MGRRVQQCHARLETVATCFVYVRNALSPRSHCTILKYSASDDHVAYAVASTQATAYVVIENRDVVLPILRFRRRLYVTIVVPWNLD